MALGGAAAYDDGTIVCDDRGIAIRWYYLWGPKRIAYSSIRDVTAFSIRSPEAPGRWRIWGSGDLRHWWNLDPHRPRKDTALELDTGGRVRPTITPDDAAAVERILRGRLTR